MDDPSAPLNQLGMPANKVDIVYDEEAEARNAANNLENEDNIDEIVVNKTLDNMVKPDDELTMLIHSSTTYRRKTSEKTQEDLYRLVLAKLSAAFK